MRPALENPAISSGVWRTLGQGAVISAVVVVFAFPVTGAGARVAQGTGGETYSFVSAPTLHPPKPQLLKREPGLATGDFLAATAAPGRPASGGGQGGPLIMDNGLEPVWFKPVQGQAFDLQQET